MEFNRPYMPSQNGIEFAWQDIKRRYRDRVGWLKVNGWEFDHMELVKQIIEATPKAVLTEAALLGERNIENAVPTDRLFWEQVPALDHVEHMRLVEAVRAPTGFAGRPRFQDTDSDDSQQQIGN
jgi:hypothetical protein